jgi:hypothetical protein
MKKNLLLTCVLSLLLSGGLYSQVAIQNGDFELPANSTKYKADGTGASKFNGNVPGWWASPGATDCGREGSHVGYAHNQDSYGTANKDSGSVWSLAGTVETDNRNLDLTFSAQESWPQDITGDILIILATYTGTDTIGFTVVDTLSQAWDKTTADGNGFVEYTFSYTLPVDAEGKNLLIGFDITNAYAATETWVNFDNFVLAVSPVIAGIKNGSQANNTSVYPNPTSDYITIETKVNESSKYSLVHSTGKEMLTGYVNNNERIDVSSLDGGIYFLNIHNSLGSEVIKTVIK